MFEGKMQNPGHPKSVWRQNAKHRPPEMFVYLKSAPKGKGVEDLGNITSKPVIDVFSRVETSTARGRLWWPGLGNRGLRNQSSAHRPRAARRRIRPGRLPLRRACTHTCLPSHVNATHCRHYHTQIVIFWGKNIAKILNSQRPNSNCQK